MSVIERRTFCVYNSIGMDGLAFCFVCFFFFCVCVLSIIPFHFLSTSCELARPLALTTIMSVVCLKEVSDGAVKLAVVEQKDFNRTKCLLLHCLKKILKELCMFYLPLFILIYFDAESKNKNKRTNKALPRMTKRLARHYRRHGGYL